MLNNLTPAIRLGLLENQIRPSPLSKIKHPLLLHHQLELWIKRDDLLHPIISGNKWRKLKYILKQAVSENTHTIISMGGTYSNHLHALAYIGKVLGVQTIGMIRGEPPKQDSATLADLKTWGMQLQFVNRAEYRKLRAYRKPLVLPDLRSGQYWLPEGGALSLAFQGIDEMVAEIDINYDYLCVPCGSGTTMAGMINAVVDPCSVIGFAALKGAAFLYRDIEQLLTEIDNNKKTVGDGTIMLDYHFGGFARTRPELIHFMLDFKQQTDISLDNVYTGKMLFGIFDLIKQGYFSAGKRIMAIHTGGLQGNRGYTNA
jgi:1-aminocyclopropane-1-carboxylate deaminase